jgi:glucan 1,3-beta-glucosidase
LGKSAALKLLQPHWDSFVQESDIAALAGTGINLLRIPVGHFMLSILDSEPWVNGANSYEEAFNKKEGTQVYYLFRTLYWAKKYNLRVVVDVHTMPGSQNGFDNSGVRGTIEFWQPDNMSRGFDFLQQLTILLTSDPNLVGTIVGIELLNEPMAADPDPIYEFYERCYWMIRSTQTNPPSLATDLYIWISDGFHDPLNIYKYGLEPYHRVMFDPHVYQIFALFFYPFNFQQHLNFICDSTMHQFWQIGGSNATIPTVIGEWSMALSDCTPNINGFNTGNRQNGSFVGSPGYGSCSGYNANSFKEMDESDKAKLKQYLDLQISAYESASGWVFWNFKTENQYPQWDWLAASQAGLIPQPLGKNTITSKCEGSISSNT